MGYFNIALRFALVVASVVADGGDSGSDEHLIPSIQIGLAKGALVKILSEPKAKETGFISAGKFSSLEGDSLYGSSGGFGYNRQTKNDFGNTRGVASQFESSRVFRGNGVKYIDRGSDGVGGRDELKGDFASGITRLYDVHGGQKVASAGHGYERKKEDFDDGIIQDDKLQGASNIYIGHERRPLIFHEKIIRYESERSKNIHSNLRPQEPKVVQANGGLRTFQLGIQEPILFSAVNNHGIGHRNYGGTTIHHGKHEDGESFESEISDDDSFDFEGLGLHAILDGVGGGNFFGYKEEDFLPIRDVEVADGLAGRYEGNDFHGATVVKYDGSDVHIGHSDTDSFGDDLSGTDGGQSGETLSSAFIASTSGELGSILTDGDAIITSIKAVRGGSLQSFGADYLPYFGGDVGEGDYDLGDIEGVKLDVPAINYHVGQHQTLADVKSESIEAVVKEAFVEDESQAGKSDEADKIHDDVPEEDLDDGDGEESKSTTNPEN